MSIADPKIERANAGTGPESPGEGHQTAVLCGGRYNQGGYDHAWKICFHSRCIIAFARSRSDRSKREEKAVSGKTGCELSGAGTRKLSRVRRVGTGLLSRRNGSVQIGTTIAKSRPSQLAASFFAVGPPVCEVPTINLNRLVRAKGCASNRVLFEGMQAADDDNPGGGSRS